MAEARAIATLSSTFKRNSTVRLLKDDQGVTVTITIPPLRAIFRALLRRWHRLRRNVFNLVYPMGLVALTAMMALAVAIVMASPPDGWWRNGPVAHFVWNVMLWLPYFSALPTTGKIAASACAGAVMFFAVLALVQRYLLRFLLGFHGWLYLEPGKKNFGVMVWGFFVNLLIGRNPMLYTFRGSLPHLPVPALHRTVEKYLRTVQGLQTAEEFKKTQENAKAFLANEGPRLQRYLVLKSWISNNYISDWWENYVYLRGRSSIMINSNYYALDQAYVWPTSNQIARAANLVYEMTTFARHIDRETLPPLMIRNLVPLCMDQLTRMFSTCRVPGKEMDSIVHYDMSESKHIVVEINGIYYYLPVMGRDNEPLCAWELEQQLEWIQADAAKQTRPKADEAGISALTAVNRTTWAEAREKFFSEGLNYASLSAIESAVLVLHLSDEEPKTWTEQGHTLLHGEGDRLWFDKSINLVAFKNGKCGMNCEHGWGDATAVAHMFEVTCLTSEKGPTGIGYDANGRNNRPQSLKSSMVVHQPRRITWEMSTELTSAISAARAEAKTMAVDLDLNVLCQDKYGKDFMKKVGVSPDAFIQLMLQLAYRRDAGRFNLTYEAAMTRLFRAGRTETVRPVTPESCDFVNAVLEKRPKEEVFDLLRKAAEVHNTYNKDAMCGKGIDRHLFGLYVVSVGKNIESPFLKSAVGQPWMLSTSQQPQASTDRWDPSKNPEDAKRRGVGGGFGPVADDGYGVSYMVAGNDQVFFHVSSKRSAKTTDSTRFGNGIKQAFTDVAAIWNQK